MHAASLLFPGDNGNVNYGFAHWSDQGYHYSYTFDSTATSLKLGFGATIGQGINDESWGVDNIMITDNSGDHVACSAALRGLAFRFGIAELVGRQKTQSRVMPFQVERPKFF